MTSSIHPSSASRASGGSGGSLKAEALGLTSGTVVGLASTAPAYSLAATLGPIVFAVGVQAPAAMWLAFIPTLCIAVACQQLNRAEPDCGSSFIWTARAFGPSAGWVVGWAMLCTSVLVMATMAKIAGKYMFLLLGADELAQNPGAITAVGILLTFGCGWLCLLGIELSVRAQCLLLGLELVALLIFAIVALSHVNGASASGDTLRPALDWFNPFSVTSSALANGVLLALFIYWGWDAAFAVNEESVDLRRVPGRAALMSTLVLVATYLLVTVASVAVAGPDLKNLKDSEDLFSDAAAKVLGHGPFDQLLFAATLTSAVASMQTTILAAARAMFSMGRRGALPAAFAWTHRRRMTPTVATLVMVLLSVGYFLGMTFLSKDLLEDSITSISLMIAFYYALTAFACAWRFRHECLRSPTDFTCMFLLPMAGGLALSAAFVKFALDALEAGNGKTSLSGIDGVFALGIGLLCLGLLIAIAYRHLKAPYFTGRTLDDSPEAR